MIDAQTQMTLYTLFAGASVALGAWVVISTLVAAHGEAARIIEDQAGAQSPLFKAIRPVARWLGFLAGGLAARIEMRMGREAEQSLLLNWRVRVEKRLRAAARPEGVTADEFLGMMFLGMAVGAAVGFAAYLRLNLALVIFVGAFIGALWPQSWLSRQLKNRRLDIRRHLPYTLDLLTLSVEAGLDFTEALGRITTKLGDSALATELDATLRDIRLGRTRAEALRMMARRLDMSEITSVTSALIQADELGAALGPVLRAQADQLRVARSQDAEKKALEAPVKILFPLIFFILPTIFIIIGGPILLQYVGG